MSERPGQTELETLRRLLALAREEDLGAGDVTAALLPAEVAARAAFVAREELVVCGAAFLAEIAAAYHADIRTETVLEDGSSAPAGAVIARWSGPARAILSAERVALNFLQRLSGAATVTRAFVRAVAGTRAGIYDTRKTTPGWRALEKYAVRCGGGRNHRIGLYDAVLVKDNHLAILAAAGQVDPLAALAGPLERAKAALAKQPPPGGFIQVEVDTLEQLRSALRLPVDMVLLDNMAPDQLAQAVAIRDRAGLAGRVELEASGGVTLATVRAIAESGVERISAGALTHSARSVDIALDVEIG
ncbi:MAG: putative nicotinate-nucleotide pyrophosphorylase (carboxylating) [Planctomycetes bacterium ADurb.Bin126]|nr:MAG: putative nicotinate-nucleotide pyrophosphorylase (carboxylating) [Planctomycetes bacterium ADurb.Bin126]HQL72488.1 carboxylating nicotinate-nucleotide diphosphorylase [Phycisphaerae bacterium]